MLNDLANQDNLNSGLEIQKISALDTNLQLDNEGSNNQINLSA